MISLTPRFSEVTRIEFFDVSRFNGFLSESVETLIIESSPEGHLAEARRE
jgi:hypothetical protein